MRPWSSRRPSTEASGSLPDQTPSGASLRLLWDELLSWRVPEALRILGYRTSYVGRDQDDAPPRTSTDEVVISHAKKVNEIIVTSNHDMMLLCAEAGQRFVWLDPRGRQLTRAEQVLLVLRQIDRWHDLLAADEQSCIRAMRTRCSPIEPSEAARLAERRQRELHRRKRNAARHNAPPPGQMTFEGNDQDTS